MARALLLRFWTDTDRDELKRLFNQGWSVQKIARRLKRSPSGIRTEMMLLCLSIRESEARSRAQKRSTADVVGQSSGAPLG
jgi:IS30 family transposase